MISDNLRINGVKIVTSVKGVSSFGSGVVYLTPSYCDYNYVLTAKHIFQEASDSIFDASSIFYIEVLYSQGSGFDTLQHIRKKDVKSSLITFDEDFAIIVINKFHQVAFQTIHVADSFEDTDLKFFSWGVFSANSDSLQKFDFERNDTLMKRFKLLGNHNHQYLTGMSGSGLMSTDKTILYGIICRYPNIDFQNETVDCVLVTFEEINAKLLLMDRLPLESKDSKYRREISNKIVDIHQARINGVALDLDLARKRLQNDLVDDWYYDPLSYVDLLSRDFLFSQFANLFGEVNYQAEEAEKFYVPKKKYTLREALVSPIVDRIMYMAAVGVIAKRLDDSMLPNVYSARFNRFTSGKLIIPGVEQWKKMKYQIAQQASLKNEDGSYKYGCIIEIDLLNFYDNIKKSLLCDKIDRICETTNEKNASKLLRSILEKISTKDVGLPQNSDASSLLASFYLNQVDIFMQHNVQAYYRFMDDIRIFCADKYEARRILKIFEFELRRCHLSVNSQKTEMYSLIEDMDVEIKAGQKRRSDFEQLFDLELNKIAALRRSDNYVYRNEAFHSSVKIIRQSLDDEDLNSSEDSSRRLNFSLNTLAMLGKNDLNLLAWEHNFKECLEVAVESLKDKPWITPQVCKVLNLVPSDLICEEYLNHLKPIVLNDKYNTYSFQAYQIWLLLAKHKCSAMDLKTYAVNQIERNDETNRPAIAAMVIYMCSVDQGYRRVVLRKFSENFTRGYFQNRLALISIRNFPAELIDVSKISSQLKFSHEFTHRHKDKDLVYVYGFDESGDENDEEFEQLYSI